MDAYEKGLEALAAGDYAGGERLLRESIAWGYVKLGAFRAAIGDPSASEAHYRNALEASPGFIEAEFGLSLTLLRLGRYAEAWPLAESRRHVERLQRPVLPPICPEWAGEPLDGRRLLVCGEEGFGDQIMFARFLPELERGGARVTYLCAAPVAPLFREARDSIRKQELAEFDFWIYGQSLPLRLGTTLETLPAPYPLTSGVGGGGIGVMTRGRPEFINDARRSLDPESAAELLALGRDLHPDATGARDFAETAEIIGELDLIITVDTAIAHLAGSMGKSTWILLPAILTDWRWLQDRTDSPWYPSARLFRQSTPSDWRSVIQAVKATLA